MDIFAKHVDLLEQLHILLHDARVLLLVDILVFLEHLSQIADVVLEVLALVSVLAVEVCIALLILDFLLDVLLVEADDTLLELLEVSDVVKALEHIVLELLLEALLLIELFSQVRHLVSETFLSHTQVVHDQCEVLVHTVKVLELLSHLVCLLIQFLDLDLPGPNVSLQFLYLVVKNELELFEFLSLLLEVIDALVLILDSGLTLLDLTLLRVDLLSKRVGLLNQIIELLLLLVDILLSLVLLLL